jgi:hypothetical protein
MLLPKTTAPVTAKAVNVMALIVVAVKKLPKNALPTATKKFPTGGIILTLCF